MLVCIYVCVLCVCQYVCIMYLSVNSLMYVCVCFCVYAYVYVYVYSTYVCMCVSLVRFSIIFVCLFVVWQCDDAQLSARPVNRLFEHYIRVRFGIIHPQSEQDIIMSSKSCEVREGIKDEIIHMLDRVAEDRPDFDEVC